MIMLGPKEILESRKLVITFFDGEYYQTLDLIFNSQKAQDAIAQLDHLQRNPDDKYMSLNLTWKLLKSMNLFTYPIKSIHSIRYYNTTKQTRELIFKIKDEYVGFIWTEDKDKKLISVFDTLYQSCRVPFEFIEQAVQLLKDFRLCNLDSNSIERVYYQYK